MRVLQVISTLETGGAEMLLSKSIRYFEEKGIEMDVLTLSAEETLLSLFLRKSMKGKIIALTVGSVYNPLLIRDIIPLLRNYDVVHVHLFPALYWVVLAKWLSFHSIPLVYTEHSTDNKRRRKFLWKYVDRIIYRGLSQIVTISKEVDLKLKQYIKIRPEKFKLINNGIEICSFANALPYEKSDFFNTDAIILIQVSSFRYPKDQKTLIKALSYLPCEFKLLLVGTGSTQRECIAYTEALGVAERVIFLGSRDDVPRLLKTSDVVILSSFYEGLSLSNLEGMASGRPFLASDVPGLREIVNQFGILFEAGNAEDLAKKIDALMKDNILYKTVVEKCQERVSEFDIKKMVNKYSELYEMMREHKS